MGTPTEILAVAYQRAVLYLNEMLIANSEIVQRIELICRDIRNRACARFILACTLAKAHSPTVDIRKPYTEIHADDAYSGRTYDERYITAFIFEHRLPCNTTTAFLTPAFRNRNMVLTPDVQMVGRPEILYRTALQLLTDVQSETIAAEDVLSEAIRWLLIVRDEQRLRLNTLLAGLKVTESTSSLSAETIVSLIEQHLKIRGSSRLPVLIVAAAYKTAVHLGEEARPLESHNAADEQTGALGDVEIMLSSEAKIFTIYEMKTRRVIQDDLDQALQKLERATQPIGHYVFITTEAVDEAVKIYAASLYEQTGGIEVVVLDCIGFLRYFLHLFHRHRSAFLDAYQQLVLAEPNSSVSQPLKEAFLVLRQAAESSAGTEE